MILFAKSETRFACRKFAGERSQDPQLSGLAASKLGRERSLTALESRPTPRAASRELGSWEESSEMPRIEGTEKGV